MSEQFNSLLEMLRKNNGSSTSQGVPPHEQQSQVQTITPPLLTGSQNQHRPSYMAAEDIRSQSRSVPPQQGANNLQQRPTFPSHLSNENVNPQSLLNFLTSTAATAPSVQQAPPAPLQQSEPQPEPAREPPVNAAVPSSTGDHQSSPQARQVSPQDLVDQMLKRVPSHKAEEAPAAQEFKREPTPQKEPSRPAPPTVNPEDLVMQLFGRTKPTQPSEQPSTSTAPISSASASTTPKQTAPLSTAPLSTPPLSAATLSNAPLPSAPISTAPLGGGGKKLPIERAESPSSSLMRMIAGSPPVPQNHQSFFPPAAPTPPCGTPQPSEPSSPLTPHTLFNYVNPFDSLSATRPRNKDMSKGPLPGKPSALRYQESAGPTPDPSTVPLPFSPPEGPSTVPSPQNAAEKQPERKPLSEQEQELKNSFFSSASLDLDKELLTAAEASLGISEQPKEQLKENLAPVELPASAPEAPAPPPAQATPPVTQKSPPVQQPPVQQERMAMTPPPEESYDIPAEEIKPIAGKIYTFPMKPFSSLTINPPNNPTSRPPFPESRMFDIAKMPRTTDQSDRNLIAGSNGFIVYAMSKGKPGIRVIRQDDGKDKVLNKDGTDRSFNLSIGEGEGLLATTVNGSVLWADLINGFNAPDWSAHSFTFPPYEEQQGPSNGLLKSRARKTSKHADVFAIGRGKLINFIHAPTARAYVKKKQVDSKRYLAEHGRSIDTGKASKDFCFSEDDTVVASIDKAGKLKLWDVEALMKYAPDYNANEAHPPQVLNTPALTLSAVAPGESYRATSIMLLDKHRPMAKAMALRYAIVGMKQNYSLQLWDLALGRPVQELNFPQASENDGMCSIAYHPPTGNIVVGNPARNSIFLIHFSAPKYSLNPMSQAQFINGLASKSDAIPFPDATAILSVLREYSLDSKGTLSSLDVLDHCPLEGPPVGSNPALEIFFAHSKGLTSLNLYKQDLSMDSDFKSQYAVNAVEAGVCNIAALQAPPPADATATPASESKSSARETPRNSSPHVASKSTTPANASTEKADSSKQGGPVKRKPVPRSVSPAATAPVGDEAVPGASTSRKERRDKSKAKPAAASSSSGSKGDITNVELDVLARKLEKLVVTTFSKELDTLRKSLDDDRKAFGTAAESNYEAILKMVSSTLTNNVEKSLAGIVSKGLEEAVTPRITQAATSKIDESVDRVITHRIREQLPSIISSCLATNLPAVLRKELGEHYRSSGEVVSTKLRKLNEEMLNDYGRRIRDSLVETLRESNKKRDAEFAQLMEVQRQQAAKIDQLTQVVAQLSQNIQTMAKQQIEFHERVDKAQAEWEQTNTQQYTPAPEVAQPPPPPQKSKEQIEREEVEALMLANRYQDGTIKWLQSKTQQVQLFDEVLRKHMFDFSVNLSQVVILSVAAALTASFENSLHDRLAWLEAILNSLNPLDDNINEHVDKIMTVVQHRLEKLFEQVSRTNTQHDNPVLRKIAASSKKCRELSEIATRSKVQAHQPQPHPQYQPSMASSGATLAGSQGMGGYGHQGYGQARGGWEY